jgi:branched-chain amino acid transport system permease protein
LLILQILVAGIALGCVYGLIALGLVLIYKATEAVNFAQGDLHDAGRLPLRFTLIGIAGLPFWLGFVLAVSAMALIGAAMQRVLLQPLLGQPQFAVIMLTIGIGFLLRSGASMIPGWGTVSQALPNPFAGKTLEIGALTVAQDHLSIILATLALSLLLYLFFRFTRFGLAMQAASQNQLAAAYMGIPVQPRVRGHVWALAAAVACIAGVLLAPISLVDVNMGFIGLKAFPAAVLGGFTSLPGAVVGGIIIGVIEVSAASTCRKASRTSQPMWSFCCSGAEAPGPVRVPCSGCGPEPCASSSRPATTRTSTCSGMAARCSGTACSRSCCSARPGCWASTGSANSLMSSSRHRRRRPDAAPAIPASVARPRRLPRHRRLYRSLLLSRGIPFPVSLVLAGLLGRGHRIPDRLSRRCACPASISPSPRSPSRLIVERDSRRWDRSRAASTDSRCRGRGLRRRPRQDWHVLLHLPRAARCW